MLLEVKGLRKNYINRGNLFTKLSGDIHAVDDISFSLDKGQILSLVGESGSGKTTTGKLVLRLIEPTAGEVFFNGIPIFQLSKREMFARRRDMQIVFQDPYGSLNPRMTIGSLIGEAFRIHSNLSKKEIKIASIEILNLVGLSGSSLDKYPYEFSGGQRQRICIARVIALKPQFIVCDEAVSSLDISVRLQILDLLIGLQEIYGISYLFITHDLDVAKRISNHIAVMFKGKIVEKAETNRLFHFPLHPYTKRLLAAIPVPDPFAQRKRCRKIFDDLTFNQEKQNGCSFYRRCTERNSICKEQAPDLVEISNNHYVSCHKVRPQNSINC